MAEGTMGPLSCAKFHTNQFMGWECSPKMVNSFGKESPRRGEHLPISTIIRGFYTRNYTALVFYI